MGEVKTTYTVDINDLVAKLNQARGEMTKVKKHAEEQGEGIGKALAEKLGDVGKELGNGLLGKIGLGAGIGEAVFKGIEGIHEMIEQGAKIYDLSRRFDTSTDSIQRMGMMAKLGGTDMETLVGAATRLQRSLEKVDDPTVMHALRELNLNPISLAGLDPETLLGKFSEGFKEASRDGRSLDATLELIGRSGGELLPLLRDFDEIKKAAENQPLISQEDIELAKRFEDSIARIGKAWEVYVAKVVAHPIDTLTGQSQESDLLSERRAQYEKERKDFPESSMLPENRDSSTWDNIDNKLMSEKWAADDKKRAAEDAATQKQELDMAKKRQEEAEKLTAAEERLKEAQAATAEAGMHDTQKLTREKERLSELDKQIAFNAVNVGVKAEEEQLRLLEEREKQLAKIAETQKRIADQAKEFQQIHERERDATEKLMRPDDRLQAIKTDLARIFRRDGVNDLDELHNRALATENSNPEEAKRLHEDYSRALEKGKELADLQRPLFLKGDIAQGMDWLHGKSGADTLFAETRKQTTTLESINRGIQSLLQKEAVVIDPTARFDSDEE